MIFFAAALASLREGVAFVASSLISSFRLLQGKTLRNDDFNSNDKLFCYN